MDGTRSNRYHDFFSQCCSVFPHVVYVVGNHEHYNGDFKYTVSDLKNNLGYLKNLHILDREIFVLDDVTFVGSTLWTDMNNEDPLTLYHMTRMMNDFRCITNSNRMVSRTVPVYEYNEDGSLKKTADGFNIPAGTKRKETPATFSPEDAVFEHKLSMQYIRHVVNEDPNAKFVVVSHHTPSPQSCHPRYKHDQIMNGGYHTNLEEFMLDHPQIKLWTHGHTHEDFDYMVGETRVVCNPRGYVGHEARAKTFTLKVVEV
jgi:DNA repair exonuclease SbcCD nuclease subunit